MVVTMAAPANPGTLLWLDGEFLLEAMDLVNVMTSDFAGPWTNDAGHNFPLSASSKSLGGGRQSSELAMKYLVNERGMPANRLAVGISLYGRAFAVAEPCASTRDAPKVRLPNANHNLHELQHDQGWTRLWGATRPRPPGCSPPTARP